MKTADGRTAKAKYLVLAAGFAAKRYVPPWKGIAKFKGVVHHSSFWPDEDIPVEGKKCAIIGTGATGCQITQAWGPRAGHLKVFQRTPNLTVPMRRRKLTREEQDEAKRWYPELFDLRERCFGGFLYTFSEKNCFEDTPEDREKFFEKLWTDGGFRYWLGNYKDYLFDKDANRAVYDFWAKKQRARIQDPKTRDILAPLEPPHPWGVKRPCLEYAYLEQFNRDNVDVIDIRNNAILDFDETGILMADGTHHDFDIVCIATGFDVVTGGMTAMGLRDIKGNKLNDQWKDSGKIHYPGVPTHVNEATRPLGLWCPVLDVFQDGLQPLATHCRLPLSISPPPVQWLTLHAKTAITYLGTTVPGYPNMFHLYGPQGPTLLSNGPTSVEIQGRWIVDAIKQMERDGIKYINPTDEAGKEWKQKINKLSDASLFPTTKSTYMGTSPPFSTLLSVLPLAAVAGPVLCAGDSMIND